MKNVAYLPGHEPDEAPQAPQKPARGPQLEDGYTQIANELLETVMAAPLTLREMRVVIAVIRLTYGWNRKQARVTGGLLAKLTGMPATKASAALSSLVHKNVIVRHGGSRSPVSLNKYADQWTIDEPARVTPPPKEKSEINQYGPSKPNRFNSNQNGKSECYQNGNASKDMKDMTTSNEVEATAAAETAPKKRSGSSSLPACPHGDLLDLWAEIMPDKRQPVRGMWIKSARARNLAARWKQGFSIPHGQTGEMIYHDTESGLEWWGRFFAFLRKSEFLMRDDSRFFGLDWIAKAENFEKIMELKYHGGDA